MAQMARQQLPVSLVRYFGEGARGLVHAGNHVVAESYPGRCAYRCELHPRLFIHSVGGQYGRN